MLLTGFVDIAGARSTTCYTATMSDPIVQLPHPTSSDTAGVAPYTAASQETPPHTMVHHETSRETTVHQAMAEPVVIAEENSITLDAALQLAAAERYPIAKSTLQRRAKQWREQGTAAAVKSVLIVLPSIGATYRIDREDFIAYIFDQKNNLRTHSPEHAALEHQQTDPLPQPPAAVAGEPAVTSRNAEKYVVRLETENEFLRQQVTVKDKQIGSLNNSLDHMLDRDKETNVLIQSLQGMLTNVLGLQQRNVAADHDPNNRGGPPPDHEIAHEHRADARS